MWVYRHSSRESIMILKLYCYLCENLSELMLTIGYWLWDYVTCPGIHVLVQLPDVCGECFSACCVQSLLSQRGVTRWRRVVLIFTFEHVILWDFITHLGNSNLFYFGFTCVSHDPIKPNSFILLIKENHKDERIRSDSGLWVWGKLPFFCHILLASSLFRFSHLGFISAMRGPYSLHLFYRCSKVESYDVGQAEFDCKSMTPNLMLYHEVF